MLLIFAVLASCMYAFCSKCHWARVREQNGECGPYAFSDPSRRSCPYVAKQLYILQRWSNKWGIFVDVKEGNDVIDGDKLTAVPLFPCGTTPTVMSSVSMLYLIWMVIVESIKTAHFWGCGYHMVSISAPPLKLWVMDRCYIHAHAG